MDNFRVTWGIGIFIILFLQLLGGGVPLNQDFFFYIGYFFTPVLLSFFITLICHFANKFLPLKPFR